MDIRVELSSSASIVTTRQRPDDTPVVSVIIPTYNRLALLREAVKSVRAQTFTSWELIIADDGSTDGTRSYLEQLAREDSRVRPLFLDHAGSMTVMRTAGIRAMRGTWIALLDSDDLWLPQKLSVQLRELGKHPECGWSYTGYHHIDENGHPSAGRTPLQQPVTGWIAEHLITFTVASAPHTLMMRRSLFHEAGGFDHSLYVRSDYDLMLRMALRSEACGVMEDLAMAREHASRTSNHFPELAQLKENEAMFARAGAAVASGRLRALCAEQRAVQWLSMANAHRNCGRSRDARLDLLHAVRIAPTSLRIWRGAVGQIARHLGLRRQRSAQ